MRNWLQQAGSDPRLSPQNSGKESGKQPSLLTRTLGTLSLSFGLRVERLGDGLASSLSEQRGPDAGRKQIVARMGFPEVPARSGGGLEARAEPGASPGSSSAPLPAPRPAHDCRRDAAVRSAGAPVDSGGTGASLAASEEVRGLDGLQGPPGSRGVRSGSGSVTSLLLTWGHPFLALAASLYLSNN